MSRPVRSLLPAAEAALVALSLAVVLGFGRLFVDGSFFPRLAAFVLVAHATAIATRRAGWSVATGGLVSLAVLVVTVGVVLYPDSTLLGVPTPDTLRFARQDLADIWTQFQSVQAPAPVTTSFLLAAGLALWWSAFVADWAAFRVWVPFESVVPAGTVFVFSSLWAAHESQVLLSGIFLFAAMGFLLVHRVTRQQSNAGWVSTDVQRGTNSLLRTGATLAIVAVVAAMIIGPNLPQARSAGVIALRGAGGGPSARTTVSPLVDIAHRLVQQSAVELFTVKSEQRSYWRMTALDQFDGQIWKSDGSYESASGRLPESVESSASTAVFKQTYTIGTLDTIWLPAAYEPRSVEKASTEVRYEPTTSTLIVGTTVQNSNSVAYSVQSALPLYDPVQLENAPTDIPGDIAKKDLQLPPDFSANAAAEAQRVTAGATTEYDKALALQDYFRNSFIYDLNVPPGHGESAIEDFLATKRAGTASSSPARTRRWLAHSASPPGWPWASRPAMRIRSIRARITCGGCTPMRGPRCSSGTGLGVVRAHTGPRRTQRRAVHACRGIAGNRRRHRHHARNDHDRLHSDEHERQPRFGHDAAERRGQHRQWEHEQGTRTRVLVDEPFRRQGVGLDRRVVGARRVLCRRGAVVLRGVPLAATASSGRSDDRVRLAWQESVEAFAMSASRRGARRPRRSSASALEARATSTAWPNLRDCSCGRATRPRGQR